MPKGKIKDKIKDAAEERREKRKRRRDEEAAAAAEQPRGRGGRGDRPTGPAPVSSFAMRLAAVAENQFNLYRYLDEGEEPLASQIRRYWTDIGREFPGVETAWSAVFVSWCVLQAGATKEEFEFSSRHSVFVRRAIRNAAASTGVFRAYPIADVAPAIGDIIQNNRNGNTYDFAFATANAEYDSHSAIVYEIGVDSIGPYVMTAGGNESDGVGQKRVSLDADGRVRQKPNNPYICVVKNLKP